MLILGFAEFPFRDFESYLRKVVGLDEDDTHIILKQYNSKILLYEISPGIYSSKDNSEVVYTLGDQKKTLGFENEDISMKVKT